MVIPDNAFAVENICTRPVGTWSLPLVKCPLVGIEHYRPGNSKLPRSLDDVVDVSLVVEFWGVEGKEQQISGAVRVSAIAPGVVDTPMQAEIREAERADFPDVDRFRQLKEAGDLVSPEEAARKMWAAIESRLESGAVIDLRNF